MYAHRHKVTGLVAFYIRDEDLHMVAVDPDADHENIFVPGDPYELFESTLPNESPEPDKAVGNSYLIDDMNNPPPECPPGVLAPIDDTMDTPDIEYKLGARTIRCMPVEKPKAFEEALVEILDEQNVSGPVTGKVMRDAAGRAKGKSRKLGSIKPKKAR